MIKISKRSALLACGGLVLAATAALAGSGVGGVFNLGQVNTVNARTQLQGTTSTQSLRVVNSSTAPGSAAISSQANRGTGVLGSSTSRMGVRALATNTSGVNYGIYATTASHQGLAGFFQSTGSPPDLTYGTALRAFGAGATGNEIDRRAHAAAAGEFIGYVGVTGASSLADGGAGILGLNGAGDYGVYAVSDSAQGYAGFFQNTSVTTNGLSGGGIRVLGAGATGSLFPPGLYRAGAEFAGSNGVVGVSSRTDGTGVIGVRGNGLYGLVSIGPAQISGNLFVLDNLDVDGVLTKGSGTFKIDHPLDPANKYLSHSFVESPDMMNIYNGNVVTDAEGEAIVELPGYFEALNRDPRYQLTVIGSPATAYVSRKVSENRFAIQTSQPGVEVSWQVTGIRQDAFAEAHPVVVEEEKALAERGRYLHPAELGMPSTLGIGASVASGAGVGETRTLQ